MTDLNEAINKPLEVEMVGKKWKVRRPDLASIFAVMEKEITQADINANIEAADAYGYKGQARFEFLARAHKDRPKGAELQQMITDALGTPDGIRRIFHAALDKDQSSLTDRDIDLIVADDPEYASDLATYLCGGSKNVPTREEEKEEEVEEKETPKTSSP